MLHVPISHVVFECGAQGLNQEVTCQSQIFLSVRQRRVKIFPKVGTAGKRTRSILSESQCLEQQTADLGSHSGEMFCHLSSLLAF